ncbi:MAG: signal peptidase I [Clostridia bacterium]|nr:signal peptidase I [Clostridia bacterium]
MNNRFDYYTTQKRKNVNKPQRDDNELWKDIVASLLEWLESIAFALGIVVFIFTFVLRIVIVDGNSMVPTLHDTDRILVSCLFYEPDNNDVVIIMPSEHGYSRPLVKRVIATEGQTVDIIDGSVYVDGIMLEESFPLIDEGNEGDHEYPVTVPQDCVFVIGDNRNASTDSRFEEVGMVHTEDVLGKVVYRIYPFTDFGRID